MPMDTLEAIIAILLFPGGLCLLWRRKSNLMEELLIALGEHGRERPCFILAVAQQLGYRNPVMHAWQGAALQA